MKIDTRTGQVTLDAFERKRLEEAAAICRAIQPHVSNEVRSSADRVVVGLTVVRAAMRLKDKPED